jgi:hypothetical protein
MSRGQTQHKAQNTHSDLELGSRDWAAGRGGDGGMDAILKGHHTRGRSGQGGMSVEAGVQVCSIKFMLHYHTGWERVPGPQLATDRLQTAAACMIVPDCWGGHGMTWTTVMCWPRAGCDDAGASVTVLTLAVCSHICGCWMPSSNPCKVHRNGISFQGRHSTMFILCS